jgi:hypothetical protein
MCGVLPAGKLLDPTVRESADPGVQVRDRPPELVPGRVGEPGCRPEWSRRPASWNAPSKKRTGITACALIAGDDRV